MSAVSDDVVRQVVALACRAPSIHNTQPWLWRWSGGLLELHMDRCRQLGTTDPAGRQLVISCGTALHHACVASAALGLEATVMRVPDGPASTALARIVLSAGSPVPSAESDLHAIRDRYTDRRRFTSWPVPGETLQHLADSVGFAGVHALPVLDTTARFRVELLATRAFEQQCSDRRVSLEQEAWVQRSAREGIPRAVLPDRSAAAGPSTRFLTDSSPDREVEGADGLILLWAEEDDAPTWLRVGEGLSNLWLAATRLGLCVVPLSQVIESVETRDAVRHDVLGGLVHPMMLVRIGWQAISRSDLPPTGRRSLDEVLELA